MIEILILDLWRQPNVLIYLYSYVNTFLAEHKKKIGQMAFSFNLVSLIQ